jgi:CspA family cold shock protein
METITPFEEGIGYTTSLMANTINGTVKRLVSDKGFGFIAADDGNEYFFHQSAVADGTFDSLREGQAVTFQTGQGPKGPRGENVRLA